MILGPYELRPDQVATIDAVRRECQRLQRDRLARRVLVVAPTGMGKTLISSGMISLMLAKGLRVAFLAHGRQLIYQKSDKLTECEIPHSVLMAGVGDEQLDGQFARAMRGCLEHQSVVVASKDTYVARAETSVERLDADVLIVDEADEALSGEWLRILTENPNGIVIGLTATPILGDGRGLGGFYRGLVVGATYSELLERETLVPCRVFAPYAVDMAGVDAGPNGEYSQPQAAQRFMSDSLIGDVVENWKRYAENRPTAVFAQSVPHSIALAAEFNKAGIPAAHIDADSDQDEREQAFRGMNDGRLKVLCNYAVVRRGVDLPILGCLVLACAMKSLRSYLQTVGRGLRACRPSQTNPRGCWWATSGIKRDVVIIDHGGNCYRHGWPTEDREWSLDVTETITTREKAKKEKAEFDGEVTCFACAFVFDPRVHGLVCPNCGAKRAKRGQRVRHTDGTLEEVTERHAKAERIDDLQKLWLQKLAIAANARRPMTIKQARVMFYQSAKQWPPKHLEPMPERHEWGMKVPALYPGFLRGKKREEWLASNPDVQMATAGTRAESEARQ